MHMIIALAPRLKMLPKDVQDPCRVVSTQEPDGFMIDVKQRFHQARHRLRISINSRIQTPVQDPEVSHQPSERIARHSRLIHMRDRARSRYDAIVRRVLDKLANHDIRGTEILQPVCEQVEINSSAKDAIFIRASDDLG